VLLLLLLLLFKQIESLEQFQNQLIREVTILTTVCTDALSDPTSEISSETRTDILQRCQV
jgi:hypothetical protein